RLVVVAEAFVGEDQPDSYLVGRAHWTPPRTRLGRRARSGRRGARGDRRMKALTVRQPWAWAIVQGKKDVENRSWRTDHRGMVAIHAGGSREGEPLPRGEKPPPEHEFVYSAIIG